MINLEKEIREQPSVLAGIAEKNKNTIKNLVSAAKAAGVNNIYFAARGTSDHASIYAQYLFGIYAGIPCGLTTPSVVSKYGSRLNFKGSLVIGVSQSGQAADVLTVIEDAKASGAVTAAITNDESSPLALKADYHLFCAAGKETSIAATKTFTAQMYLLALLCAEWSNSSDLSEILSKIPDGVKNVLDYVPAKIESFIGEYKNLEHGVILGRGTAYPIALEGALKILETNRMRMKGYPISDFHHGPMAQVHEGDFTVLLAAEGPVMDDAEAMLARLDTVGADTLVITDSESLAESRKKSILLPNLGSDTATPFFMAVTMQLIALKLTEVRGIDPDVSDVLNKITVTK